MPHVHSTIWTEAITATAFFINNRNQPTPENCEIYLSELFEDAIDPQNLLSELGAPDVDFNDQNLFVALCLINKN